MTIHHSQLEEAIQYRDALKRLIEFKSGLFGGHGPWEGSIGLDFGSYECLLTMKNPDVANAIAEAIHQQEMMLRNTLDVLDVEYGGLLP